jgi:hypothetical protein
MTAYNLECLPVIYYITNVAWVAERVDARDLKSLGSNAVPVRVRPQAPSKFKRLATFKVANLFLF